MLLSLHNLDIWQTRPVTHCVTCLTPLWPKVHYVLLPRY
jgi:hypothetical protein